MWVSLKSLWALLYYWELFYERHVLNIATLSLQREILKIYTGSCFHNFSTSVCQCIYLHKSVNYNSSFISFSISYLYTDFLCLHIFLCPKFCFPSPPLPGHPLQVVNSLLSHSCCNPLHPRISRSSPSSFSLMFLIFSFNNYPDLRTVRPASHSRCPVRHECF